ncbi:unnamed protein product [Trichobilharzia regenti]|nr:unnamed protein product [Trichobilharzia regenti]
MMIRNIGDNATKNSKVQISSSVPNKNMTNSIKIDDEISREKNTSIQKISLTQCTPMLNNGKLHPQSKQTVTNNESTALKNHSLMTSSQHTREDRKTHQTTIGHTSNLNTLTPERLNKNSVKTDDIFELTLIPLSLCHSSNTPENLCLPRLSSNTSEVQLSTLHDFKPPVTLLNNKDEEHSGNTCYSPAQIVEYNLLSAPSSLVSSAVVTSSDIPNYRSKNLETEYYQHLDSLTSTQSTPTISNNNNNNSNNTTPVTETAIMTTLTASHSNKHLYHLDSRNTSNHVITNEESLQPADRTLSNHSTFNDHRNNLLTSSECLSSSLENQKVDDFVASSITTVTTTNNNDNNSNMGSNSDFTNNRNFPLRSRSFFHLRRLDSPNSIGSSSTKPNTDILSSPYDSSNQLTVRTSSSPVSICRGDRHSNYHNYHRWQQQQQQQQQQHSCTNYTTNNNTNNSSNSVKNKHGKCDKHISLGKSIGVRSYSAMRHPNGCDTRVFRSPLDVLAPCKGKTYFFYFVITISLLFNTTERVNNCLC